MTNGDNMFITPLSWWTKAEKGIRQYVDDLSAEYKQRIKFLYAGPLPAFNFVCRHLSRMGEVDADGEEAIHILHHSSKPAANLPLGIGGGSSLYTISFNDAAVVSDSP